MRPFKILPQTLLVLVIGSLALPQPVVAQTTEAPAPSRDTPVPAATPAPVAPAPAAAPTPELAALAGNGASPLAKALQGILTRTDLTALKGSFADPKSTTVTWLEARINAHLTGRAVVDGWDVTTEPIGTANSDLQWLRVRTRLVTGRSDELKVPVRLLTATKATEIDLQSALSGLAVQGHDLHVTLAPDKGQLLATDTLTVLRTAGTTHHLALASGLRVSKVVQGKQALSFRQDDGGVWLTVPATLKQGTISISYAGSVAAGPYDFVGPDSALLRPESHWYPQMDRALHPATFRVALTVPKGWTGVAPGVLRNGAYVTDRPVSGLAIAAGLWQKRAYKVGKTTLQLFLTPASLATADACGAETAKVLGYCRDKLGEYPHTTLTVTETSIPGGYGGEAFISLGSRVLASPRQRLSFLTHEVLHSWTDRLLLGGTEGETGFLSEGLTTYLAYLYESGQSDSVPPQLRQAMSQAYLRVHGKPEDVPIKAASVSVGAAPWVGLIYQKGAMALHDLHRRLGDPGFWSLCRNLFARYADKPVGLPQFRALAETAYGESMAWWFDQWLGQAGAPRLVLRDVRAAADQGGYVITGRVVQQGDGYRVRVPVWVDTQAGRQGFTLTMARADQPFSLRVNGYPKLIALDPDYHLLTVRQPAPTLQTAPRGMALVVVGQQGSDAEEKAAAAELGQVLLAQYQDRGHSVTLRTDSDVTESDLQAAATVMLVGRPAINPWVNKVNSLPLALTEDRFVLGGKTYDLPAHGVLQTVPGPWRGNQIVGVFAGLGAPALKQMAQLRLGAAPIEVVVAGEARVVDSTTYPVLDPHLAVPFAAAPAPGEQKAPD